MTPRQRPYTQPMRAPGSGLPIQSHSWQQQQQLYPQWNGYWQQSQNQPPVHHQQMLSGQQNPGLNHAVSFALGQYAQAHSPWPGMQATQPYAPQFFTPQGYGISPTANLQPMHQPMRPQPNVQIENNRNDGRSFHQRPQMSAARPLNECTSCQKRFSSKVDLIAHRMHHVQCDHPNCTFEGDPPSLTIHKEDRHLIFAVPKRKAELSLDEQRALQNPTAMRIQGSNVKLDTPEAIATWISERKKRWPSAKVIEEKSRLKANSASAKRSLPSTTANRVEPLFHKKQRTWTSTPTADDQVAEVVLPKKPVQASVSVEVASADDIDVDDDAEGEDDDVHSASNPAISEHGSEAENDSDDGIMPMTETSPVMKQKDTAAGQPLQKLYHSTILEDFQREQARRERKRQQQDRVMPGRSKPDLLKSLLRKDVDQEMLDLALVAEFLLHNNFLRNVEMKPGCSEPLIEELP